MMLCVFGDDYRNVGSIISIVSVCIVTCGHIGCCQEQHHAHRENDSAATQEDQATP